VVFTASEAGRRPNKIRSSLCAPQDDRIDGSLISRRTHAARGEPREAEVSQKDETQQAGTNRARVSDRSTRKPA